MSVHEHFEFQARHCANLESPFMARLMTLFARRLKPGNPVADLVLGWPGDPSARADGVPLRLAGALHALRLDGLALVDVYPPREVNDDALWDAVQAAMVDHAERLLDWLGQTPQTNEVRRSAMVLPALALLGERFGKPLALFELGASGGLNLRADKFCLNAGGRILGDPNSPVQLAPGWEGSLPIGRVPEVVFRAGVDVHPLDPSSDAGQLRLKAYLWPDQPDRRQRTEAAIDIAAAHPAALTAEDAGIWLNRALSKAMPETTRTVFHTIAWQYFDSETRARAEAAMAQAAAEATETAPFAHISVEADGDTKGAAIRMTAWPGGQPELLGRADFHGRWVDWSGSEI